MGSGDLKELGSFVIGSVTVEESSRGVGGLRLRRFQEDVLNLYVEAARGGVRRVLTYLKAPTGSGKTLTLLTPLMAAQEGALRVSPEMPSGSMAVYPSRKLLVDQACNVQKLLSLIGYRRVELQGIAGRMSRVEAPWGYCRGGDPPRVLTLYEGPVGRVAVLLLFSDALDRLEVEVCGEKGCNGRRRLYEILQEALLSEARVSAVVALATTEYPSMFLEAVPWGSADSDYFLARGLGLVGCLLGRGEDCPRIERERLRRDERVRALSLFKVLFAGDMLFIDEAHLYSGSSALAVASAASWYLAYGGLRTSFLVVSTATHAGTGYESLKKVLNGAAEALGARVEMIEARPGGVVVRKPVRLRVYGYTRRGRRYIPPWAGDALAQESLPELAGNDAVVDVASRIVSTGGTFMLLGGRLYFIRVAGKKIVDALGGKLGGGFSVECIDGLARLDPLRPKYCGLRGKGGRLVVGSSAVAYGVDYPDADGGLVYARSPSEAIQKLGRLGRRPGTGPEEVEAFLLTGRRTAERLADALRGLAGNRGVVEPEKLEEALLKAFSRSRPPTPPRRLMALQAVKALYQLSLMALAFNVAFSHDAAVSQQPPTSIARKIAQAVVEAASADPGEVKKLAEELVSAAAPPGPAARSIWPLATPRTILKLQIAGSEAPLHQALRLHLYTDPTVTGRLDFSIIVDDWVSLEGALDRFLPGASVVRALEEAGASLVQLGGDRCYEESGSAGFRAVAESLSARIVYAARLGSTRDSAVAAHTAYHEMGAIPVVYIARQVRGSTCSLLDLLDVADRIAVIVPL